MLKNKVVLQFALLLLTGLVGVVSLPNTPVSRTLSPLPAKAATPAFQPKPQPWRCTRSANDCNVIKAIYQKLRADNLLKDHINSINVDIKRGRVYLEGFIDRSKWKERTEMPTDEADKRRTRAYQLASRHYSPNRIVNVLMLGPSCPPRYKECGNDPVICIEEDSECHLPPPPA